ncbi:MAG TPA: hypothetical protein VJN67_07610 [Stellaceae bacterium]|nr:hypothetical protein [Stellaceae bacterium]
MSSEISTVCEFSIKSSDDIEVQRAASPEAPIVMAARAWALAFEARQRGTAAASEGAELALYDAAADVTALKRAELALYEVVLASEQIAK